MRKCILRGSVKVRVHYYRMILLLQDNSINSMITLLIVSDTVVL